MDSAFTQSKVAKKSQKESGASLVEYGLLVALIAVVALGAVKVFGDNVAASFSISAAQLTL